jgi:hypothetical protein
LEWYFLRILRGEKPSSKLKEEGGSFEVFDDFFQFKGGNLKVFGQIGLGGARKPFSMMAIDFQKGGQPDKRDGLPARVTMVGQDDFFLLEDSGDLRPEEHHQPVDK